MGAVYQGTMPRTGVLVLCIRPTLALERLVAPLCPYHDVLLVPDAENLPCRPAAPDRPGVISLPSGRAELAGFRGSVSWLPRRSSSRCKALFWLDGEQAAATGISHWWMLEEDVLVPTEGTLLALDAAHPAADLLSPHHYVRVPPRPAGSRRHRTPSLRSSALLHSLATVAPPAPPHWSGLAEWPHWHLAAGIVNPPLASSMVCAVRVSLALVRLVGRLAATRGRLLFCEMLFNTLALQHGLAVKTPAALSGVVWRQPKYTISYAYRPERLYHPLKDLGLQARIRERGFATAAWRDFADGWVGEDSAAGREAVQRWREGATDCPSLSELGQSGGRRRPAGSASFQGGGGWTKSFAPLGLPPDAERGSLSEEVEAAAPAPAPAVPAAATAAAQPALQCKHFLGSIEDPRSPAQLTPSRIFMRPRGEAGPQQGCASRPPTSRTLVLPSGASCSPERQAGGPAARALPLSLPLQGWAAPRPQDQGSTKDPRSGSLEPASTQLPPAASAAKKTPSLRSGSLATPSLRSASLQAPAAASALQAPPPPPGALMIMARRNLQMVRMLASAQRRDHRSVPHSAPQHRSGKRLAVGGLASAAGAKPAGGLASAAGAKPAGGLASAAGGKPARSSR
jgi:hypothetical protein